MRRREICKAIGAAFTILTMPGMAQPRLRRVAFVHPSGQAAYEPTLAVFRHQMRELGYREGVDLAIEVRFGNDRIKDLPEIAAAVVASGPDVIVTATSAGTAAFKKATSTIPVVFATAGDPVEQGFVASLQRPGGNVTGVVVYGNLLARKIAEIARDAFPKAQRLALLVYTPDPASRVALEAFEPSARHFKFEPIVVRISGAGDLDRAFKELAERKPDVVFAATLAFFNSHRYELAKRAQKARMPLIGNDLRYAEAGALLSYGTSIDENYRRAAHMVDKILRGARPAELPVEQPERFQLVVNRKTAKAIGIELSPFTMLRADRIID